MITDGEDYRLDSSTISVAAEEKSKSFIINIISDDVIECNETFKVTLSAPACGVTIGINNTIEVTIKHDDGRRNPIIVIRLLYSHLCMY